MADIISSAIKAAITRFDNAAQLYAFKGSYPIEEHEEITTAYHLSRERLERAIAQLTIKDATK